MVSLLKNVLFILILTAIIILQPVKYHKQNFYLVGLKQKLVVLSLIILLIEISCL